MDFQNRISRQSPIKPSGTQADAANKGSHGSSSSDLGQRHHSPWSLFPTALDPLCSQKERLKTPSAHPFSEVSGLKSPSESRIGSQSIVGTKNIRLFGANLVVGVGSISSVNLEKSKKTFGGSDLHSPKKSILGSQPPSGHKNMPFFGSNLHLSSRSLSSCLNSPRALGSQSTLGDKNIQLLGSDLLLGGKHLSHANQEKFKRMSDISGLNSLGESGIGSQPTLGNENTPLLGSNLSSLGGNISSVDLEKSKKTSGGSDLHSPKESIFDTLPTLSNKGIRGFGSNLCLSSKNLSSINPEKSKQKSEVSGLKSPNTLPSQSTLGNKNIQQFESNLCLGSKYLAHVNQEKSNQTSDLSGLHPPGESSIGYWPSLGNGNILLLGSDLCFPGSNISSVNLEKSEHTSENLFGNKPSLHFSPSPSSHKITLPVEDSQFMEVDQNHISKHLEHSSNGGKMMSPLGSTHQEDNGSFMTEKVDLTLLRQPSRGGDTTTDLELTTETNDKSTPTDILEMTASIGNQETRELSFTSDEVEHVTVSSPHLHRTTEAKSTERRRDFDKSLVIDQLIGETSLSQETQEMTQEMSFTSSDDEIEHEVATSHLLHGTSEAKSAKRQRDSDDFLSDNQLFGGTSGTGSRIVKENKEIPTHDIQESSKASAEVIMGKDGGINSEVSDKKEEIPSEATAVHGVTGMKSLAEGNAASPEQAVHNNSENDAPPKQKRKSNRATKFPEDIRSLLKTGILDGCPVFYYDYIKQVKKYALIMGAYYLCGCSNCRYLEPVTAQEFIRHCGGSNSTRAFRLITFKTGHSIGSLINHIHNSPENMFKIISLLSGTVLNMENYRKWMEKKPNSNAPNPGNNQDAEPIPMEEN